MTDKEALERIVFCSIGFHYKDDEGVYSILIPGSVIKHLEHMIEIIDAEDLLNKIEDE